MEHNSLAVLERLVSKPENVIEISWPLSAQSTCWHNAQERSVQITHFRTWEQNKARESAVSMGLHTGTHIDAPAHFLEDGVTTDKVHVMSLMGRCKVLDLTHVEGCITEEALASKQFGEGDIILFKTKNSQTPSTAPFNTKFVYLALSGAKYIESKKVKAIGTDYLGIEREQPDHQSHKTLLGNSISIIEGLRLAEVAEGEYFLICLPLFLTGCEGAPARAVLFKV